MRRFSPAMNVDHVPSCHFLFCEQYVALLYLDTPVGKLLDRVFPPINCFFRVTRREAKPEAHRNQPAKMGKNCIESTARIGPIIPCGYIRYVCYRSNQLAVRILIRAYDPYDLYGPLINRAAPIRLDRRIPPSTTVRRHASVASAEKHQATPARAKRPILHSYEQPVVAARMTVDDTGCKACHCPL
jgi:hypothetical protein